MPSNQDDLNNFLQDPENIKEAVEGSMEKRSAVMPSNSLRNEITRKNGHTSCLYCVRKMNREYYHRHKDRILAKLREGGVKRVCMRCNQPVLLHDKYIIRGKIAGKVRGYQHRNCNNPESYTAPSELSNVGDTEE